MTVTVSTKGQVVIPSQLRKRYNLKPRAKIEFLDTGKEIVLVPLPEDPFKASYGILKGKGITTKDLIKHRREERKKEKTKYKRLYGKLSF
jgi:AbrB family looped-hinge helix DNA binding protein